MQQIKMILKVTKSMDREKDIHLLVTKINQFDYIRFNGKMSIILFLLTMENEISLA